MGARYDDLMKSNDNPISTSMDMTTRVVRDVKALSEEPEAKALELACSLLRKLMDPSHFGKAYDDRLDQRDYADLHKPAEKLWAHLVRGRIDAWGALEYLGGCPCELCCRRAPQRSRRRKQSHGGRVALSMGRDGDGTG